VIKIQNFDNVNDKLYAPCILSALVDVPHAYQSLERRHIGTDELTGDYFVAPW